MEVTMLKKSNRIPILLILLLLAFVAGYGPAVTGTAHAVGARMSTLSPIVILLIGVAIGKFLL
jgi:hypothetical protein